MRKGLALRLVFLALLVGGLLFWTRQRQPRDLTLRVDLTAALPGEISEVDVVVRRDGHAIARHDVSYGKTGAPGVVELPVHAVPGDAEVECTLVYPGKAAHRSVEKVSLQEGVAARVSAR